MNKGLAIGHEKAEIAADHAGQEWKDLAFEAFKNYAKKHRYFTTELVRLNSKHVPIPPDKRAWGHVALRAKREEIVIGDGWTRASSSSVHGMVVTRWLSLIKE